MDDGKWSTQPHAAGKQSVAATDYKVSGESPGHDHHLSAPPDRPAKLPIARDHARHPHKNEEAGNDEKKVK